MPHPTRLRAILVVAILAIAGVAAAYKLNRWKPIDVCFCPNPQRSDAASAANASDAPAGKPEWISAQNTSNAKAPALDSQAFASVPVGQAGGGGAPRGTGGAPARFTPWAPTQSGHRSATGYGSSASVSLGGLWRLMGMNSRRHEPAPSQPAAAARTPKPARETQAAPPRAPRPAPRRPPSTGGVVPAPTTGTTPTSGFGEFTLPIGDLTGVTTPTGGTLGPGGGSVGIGGGSGLASTPEPGTLALLGSGLIGIAGVLRRRRV